MGKYSRRDFNKLAGLAGLATGAAGGAALGSIAGGAALASDGKMPAPHVTGLNARPAALGRAKGARTVVVGGGWSGLTIAKYLKKIQPEMDVVLIERRSTFISHPASNLWLVGLLELETLAYSFLDAAKNNNYVYLNASVVDVDRPTRRVFTDQGYLDYDYLVLAPGLDYDYASIGVKDPGLARHLMINYPAGFVSGSEHISIRRKVRSFKGGDFVMTVPPGIFRCTASPYERACLVASYFKREKIKGKVILIDPREQPGVKAEGFLAAFEELYADTLEYMYSSSVIGVDADKKTIATDIDDVPFDDAVIYPRIRGASLIEDLGLVDPKSVQSEAHIDPIKYTIAGDERVFATGDCRPMPFSKSANVAYTEGKYVAELIAAKEKGGKVEWVTPRTLCYSMVNIDPEEAIMVDTTYRLDKKDNEWHYAYTKAKNIRSPEMAKSAYSWAEKHLNDILL